VTADDDAIMVPARDAVGTDDAVTELTSTIVSARRSSVAAGGGSDVIAQLPVPVARRE